MKRIGMTLAAAVVGGVLLTAGDAGACEGHHARKAAEAVPAPVEAGGQEQAARTEEAAAKKDGQGEQHAAKCRCGSAADCTCKKGTCECPKCKKPRQDVVPSLEAENGSQELREVRVDASAGVVI
ncbi:metallothionein [Vitiosangium sp. GDMCC 1.1324]|uniref:metallothionein n=1 Tax=Vitiosangium sp. (strain GDMCC 1.1324) TaxID=2138576 RepID=UPI000D331AA5|nr:metallothionein [Vitiosangium sp. GDMCC 1.1324]PTL77488.1 metallothionein [Vitiosangium sp. GDMCC 1.1324]